MRSIQDVGLEIMNKNPAKFYVFAGNEYGIKCKYLDIIKSCYNQSYEYPSVQDVFSIMRTRHIIPLQPALYIVRYDESFLNELNSKSEDDISSIKMIGTLVVLYENDKANSKLEKYIPNYAVTINNVSRQFVEKYLKQDFPKLTDELVKLAAIGGRNYGHAKNIGLAMNSVSPELFKHYSDSQVLKLFGYSYDSTDSSFRLGVASKNVKYLFALLDSYSDDLDKVIYTILSTMVELEKIIGNKYSDSDISKYCKLWTREDIYYMFSHAYTCLKMTRSFSVDKSSLIIYLFSLLAFQKIPNTEVIS